MSCVARRETPLIALAMRYLLAFREISVRSRPAGGGRREVIKLDRAHSNIKRRAKPRKFDFASGTVFVREWRGYEHRVTVTPEARVVPLGIN